MSKQLRAQLLLLLELHSRTGSPYFKTDSELAEATGRSVEDVQRQLDILEVEGLITSANSRDGHRARINPQGSLVVEQLEEGAAELSEKRQIGFEPER